ncbi:MAG: hypothetical protein JXR95_04505 [Deltaproteobacteria bacterium]|nr:hypothetical protein [Deltaproteobacteria bacterium]
MKLISSLIIVTGLLISCTTEKTLVNISHALVHINPGDYPKVLKRWTRKTTIIRKFDTTLDVEATLLSWEFRWGYTVKYSRDFNLSETEKKNLWSLQQSELESGIEFVLVVATTVSAWNDLEKGTPKLAGPGKKAKGSHWRISLRVDKSHDEILPEYVKVIDPVTQIHTNMFPSIGHFHRLYLVRFPAKSGNKKVLPDNAKLIQLKFTGPLGKTSLKWYTTNTQIQSSQE